MKPFAIREWRTFDELAEFDTWPDSGFDHSEPPATMDAATLDRMAEVAGTPLEGKVEARAGSGAGSGVPLSPPCGERVAGPSAPPGGSSQRARSLAKARSRRAQRTTEERAAAIESIRGASACDVLRVESTWPPKVTLEEQRMAELWAEHDEIIFGYRSRKGRRWG